MDKRYNPLPPPEEIEMRKALLDEIQEQPGMSLMTELRTLRTRTRLTVAEYSKMTCVAARTIQNIEVGRVSSTIKTADKLLKPFGLVMGVCSEQKPSPIPNDIQELEIMENDTIVITTGVVTQKQYKEIQYE